MVHDITSDEGWFHAEVEPGGTHTWQPTQPGTYQYYCSLDRNIEGVIVVSPSGPVAPD